MNPFFSTIIYAALHRRISCTHCGAYGHHKRIEDGRFLCNCCGKSFTPVPDKRER